MMPWERPTLCVCSEHPMKVYTYAGCEEKQEEGVGGAGGREGLKQEGK